MIQFLKRSDKYESFDEKQSPKLSYHIVMQSKKKMMYPLKQSA